MSKKNGSDYGTLMPLFFVLFIFFSSQLLSEDLCQIEHAVVSYYVYDCAKNEVVAEKNSSSSVVPASCMKIVTTGSALHILGEDFRFETQLGCDGTVCEGVLNGNLAICGSGDPCLGSDRIVGGFSWEKQIGVWADAVEKLGIKKINGRVIGDATRWEKALAPPSWSWEDLGNYYGAGACALTFAENAYSLVFKPGEKVGDAATVLRTEPEILSDLCNEVKTGLEGSGDQACIYGSEYSPLQIARGTIPLAVNEFVIKGAISDPPKYVAGQLTKELQRRGIEVAGENIPEGKKSFFHTSCSPSVKEIVHWTNQKSINLYAEHLLKKMGEVVYNEGSTKAGVRAVTNFWKDKKLDLQGFAMSDGSGLSRKNLVTTKQLVEMLLVMKQSPHFPTFFASLPISQGINAKSGSMGMIKGHVGYAGEIVFAIVVNQCADAQKMNEQLTLFLKNVSQR